MVRHREETAYAVRLAAAGGGPGQRGPRAGRGARGDGPAAPGVNETPHPPLWHDKDIYTPTRIVRTEILAALYVAHTSPRTAPLLADDTLTTTGA